MREQLPEHKGGKSKKNYVDPDEPEGGQINKPEGGSGGGRAGDDNHEGGDRNEGGGTGDHSDEVHELSPKAHEREKIDFLKTLSKDPIYQRFVNQTHMKPLVSHHHSFNRIYPH